MDPVSAPLSAPAINLQPFGRRPSAGEFAYASLRDAILTLVLPPGAVLSRAALAEQLGLSQTPVREALMRLQEEDLVEVVPSASTRVSRIDLNNARQAQFLRRAIEVEMVRKLAGKPPAGLAEDLEAHLSRQRALAREADHPALSAADDAFHAALYRAAGIEALWDLVLSRSGHLGRLRRLHLPSPGKAEAIVAQHSALAEAILSGEVAAAEEHLRRHFSGTFALLPEIRRAYPDYFSEEPG